MEKVEHVGDVLCQLYKGPVGLSATFGGEELQGADEKGATHPRREGEGGEGCADFREGGLIMPPRPVDHQTRPALSRDEKRQ